MGCGELDPSCRPLLQSAGRLQMGALAGSRAKERGRGQPSEGVSQTESLDSIPPRGDFGAESDWWSLLWQLELKSI